MSSNQDKQKMMENLTTDKVDLELKVKDLERQISEKNIEYAE